MLQRYWKFPNRNVQTFGFVYHDTNGQNHGPVWKIQSFPLSEISIVILWQDCYWKGNLRQSYSSTVGKRFPIENAYSYTVKKHYSYLCMCMTSNWLETTKTLIRCGKYSIKKLILGVYMGCTQRPWEISKDIVDNYRTMFESRISAGELKNYHVRKIFEFLRGLMILNFMRRNVWNDVVSWQIRRLNNSIKFLLPASMTTTLKKKKRNLLEKLS